MAVTKLPHTRKGMPLQKPPLSWPNDTAIGRRHPRLGLLKQATRTRQRQRMSSLSSSQKHHVSMPTRHASLRFPVPHASSHPRYKAHRRSHHSTQQFKGSRSKLAKDNEKPSNPAHLPNNSQVSNTSLTKIKKNAKSHKNNHKGNPSPFFPPYL